MSDPECMACRTAAGEFAADEVYRDEQVVVVAAQHAINRGHLVVVTCRHIRNALVMDDALLGHMHVVARDMAVRLRDRLGAPGVMFVFNNEEPCQSVPHAHLHVVPRHPGDEMDCRFGGPTSEAERAAVARELRDPPANEAP
jgi:diadenosine tetraphosphate (Ap4A) HIT family hydrolase